MPNPLALVWDLIARDGASPAFLATAASADKAAASTERAALSTREAGAAAASSSGAFLGLGKGLVAIGAAIGAVEVVKHAIESATKFQSSMLLIQTQAGASAAEVKKMSSAILGLAGPTAQAPEALANSLYHVESVGLRGAQALDVVKIAAEGAKVGHADLEQTTNALTAAVASGIPGVQNMSQAMGELNAIVGAGDMSMQNLNEALGSGILTVVKGYGLSITDVGAALATFGDNNIRGADAATMLRMAVQAMAVPAKAGQAELRQLGLSTTQLATDMQTGGLNKALLDLQDHLVKGGIKADQMGQILTEIFGKRAGPGLQVLEGQMTRYETKLVEVKDGGDKFGAAWKATTETMSFQWDRIKAQLDAFGIKAGTVLLPLLNKGATIAGNGLQTLGTDVGKAASSDTAKKIFAEVQADAQKLSDWFNAHRADFARIFNDLKGAAADVGGWIEAHKPMFTEIWNTVRKDIGETVNTFEHLATAVGHVVSDIKEWLDTHKKQIHETMADVDKTLRAVGAALQSGFEAIRAVVETVIKIVLDLWQRFGKQLLTHIETSLNAALQVIRGVFEVLKGLFDVITGVLTGKWGKAWNGIKEIFGGVWNIIVGLLKGFLNELSALWDAFTAVFTMAWDALWKYTIEGLTKARDWILGLISGLWNSIIGGLKDARSWLINVGKDIINGLWDGIKTAWTGAWDWLTGLAKLVTSAVGDIGNILYDAGHAIFEGFLNGLKAAWNDVTGFVGSVGGWIASHKGPLDYDRQLLIPHGNAVMAGFNEGLTTGFAKAQLNISGMAKKLSQSVQVDGLGGIYGLGSRSNALTPGGVTIINNNTMQPNQDMTSFAAVVSRTTARSMR